MDQFDEPKKINQNVLKALLFLQSKNVGFTSADEIIKQVEKQMRSSNDPPHSVELIQESLSNLTNMGVLALTGSSEYALRYSIDTSTDYIDIPKSGPKRKSKIPSRNLVVRTLLFCNILSELTFIYFLRHAYVPEWVLPVSHIELKFRKQIKFAIKARKLNVIFLRNAPSSQVYEVK